MIAEVISLKEKTNYYYKYEIKVNSFNLKFSKGTKNILYTKSDKLFPGDIIIINGEFEKASKATNYKQFDYRKYLKQCKIYGLIYEKDLKIVESKKDAYYLLGRIRQVLLERIEFNYDDNETGFMQGILVGFTNNLSKDIIENFRNSNISHILAISGMHAFIVTNFCNCVLKIFIKNKKVRNCTLIVFLMFFYLITGMSSSCLRAVIMIILRLTAFNLNRKNNFISSLIFSFLIIISINIYNILNIAIWLSFMGVLGMYIFSNSFIKIINHFYNGNKILFKIIIPIIVPQILILPVAIYSFNTISIIFLISNLIIAFLIDKILILGYLSILLNSNFLSYINSFLITIIFKVSEICSKDTIYLKTPSILWIICYYIFIFALIIYIKKYTFKFWKNILSNKKKIFKIIALTLIYLILMQFVFTELYILLNNELKIYFVDVGQGDSTVIKTPKGKNIIIDGGEENSIILPYLLDRGINKIDYLIISHFDSDHVEGLFSIMKNMKVEKVILGKQFFDSENYKIFTQIVKENNIEIFTVQAGANFYIEKDLKIEVLWPSSKNIITENELNNNSLVFKLIYKNFSILFTGDIEQEAEEAILKEYKEILKVDILKVAHHGSKTSSTEEFLKYVSPQIALIGVGRKNNFGHPSNNIIESLKNINCNIYRTDQMGEVMIKINNSIAIKTYF